MERVPITPEGYQALKKELEYLKRVERPRNLDAIEEARSHGDITENAEFEAAKDRQALLEVRVSDLETKLARADIIDPQTVPKDRVVFSSSVLLENIDTGESVQYMLVGPDEADVEEGRLSIQSPLGQALIGKKPGDEITLQAPGGTRCYELLEIF